jgi:hypothetical protein
LMQRLNQTLTFLAPPPPGALPAAASTWHDHLQSHWIAPTPEQQALLESLLDLDKLRYGPSETSETSAPSTQQQRQLKPISMARRLIKRIETQVKTQAKLRHPID